MRITFEQQQILDTLHCERLSNENDTNFRLIEDFENYRNDRIARTLKNEAYEEDMDGRLAYYLVKTQENEVLFFFSLKCGLLYDEFLEADRLKELQSFYAEMLALSENENLSKEERMAINDILEKARTKKGIKKNEIADVLSDICQKADDVQKIFGKNLKNVVRTFPGVELVHFCANDEKRDVWDSYGLPQNLGVVVFWQFVVPKIQQLMKIVGCEYLFLFAADSTVDEVLVNYYSDKLGFDRKDEHSVAIPMYDFTCQFMSQKTTSLEEKRQRFFEMFNPDEEV